MRLILRITHLVLSRPRLLVEIFKGSSLVSKEDSLKKLFFPYNGAVTICFAVLTIIPDYLLFNPVDQKTIKRGTDSLLKHKQGNCISSNQHFHYQFNKLRTINTDFPWTLLNSKHQFLKY